MIEIIPAILTDKEEEFIRLVRVLEAAGVTRVHLDIGDGEFVSTKTISGHEELRRLQTSLKFDVHLMVKDPEHYCDHWHGTSADRFIVHVESTDMMATLAEHCQSHGHQLWAAKNPETPLGVLTGLQCHLDGAMFMTIHPGQQGNPFIPEVLEQIKLFTSERPDIPVMVDGGITPTTAGQCIAAGARALVSGSYVVKSEDVARAIEDLRAAVQG